MITLYVSWIRSTMFDESAASVPTTAKSKTSLRLYITTAVSTKNYAT